MGIKSILILFSGEHQEFAALSTAFTLARSCDAHVKCLHVSPETQDIIYPDLEIGLPLTIDITQEYAQINKERLEKARAAVKKQAAAANIPLHPTRLPLHHASVSFVHKVGAIDKVTAQMGKFADLIIMGRTIRTVSADYEAAVIAALFDTGRPVLFIPPQAPSPIDNIVAVAWNESKEATRAIAAAMSFLKRSERICILTSKERGKAAYDTHQLNEYLSLHGLEAMPIAVGHEQYSIGLALMNRAKNLHVTMLVMGAFSHTRLQEMVVGGVTRFMLDYAEIPVLMVH
jgi:nucleotide-binding universal stress UspA family protein